MLVWLVVVCVDFVEFYWAYQCWAAHVCLTWIGFVPWALFPSSLWFQNAETLILSLNHH